jgi:hypothetical protein
MIINRLKRVEIILCDEDVYAMSNIIMLACAQLNDSPVFHMRGSLVSSQCGISGPALLELRDMLERIGYAVDYKVSLRDLSIPRNDVSPLSKDMSLAEVK